MSCLTIHLLEGTTVHRLDHFLPPEERNVHIDKDNSSAPRVTTELPKSETSVEETEASPLTTAESEPPAVFNDEEEQDDGPAAAVVDVAAPLETTSTAAVVHLSEFLFKAADAVLNSSIALQESGASVALHDETSVVFVLFNVALDLYTFAAEFNNEEDQEEIGPAAAVLDIAASLDMTSKIAASQVAKVLYNAAYVVHNAMAELERTCPSSIVSDVATSLDMTKYYGCVPDVAASPDETSAAAGFNNEGEQDDIGRAAAVLDVAASLDMTNVAALPAETIAAAVLQLYKILFEAADAVFNSSVALQQTGLTVALFDTAAAAFNTTALQDETSVSAVFNLALHLYDAARALQNISAALESTSSSAVCNIGETWYNAAVYINDAAAALHEASPAGTVFETAVAVLDVTVAVDANSAQAWLPVVEAVFNDGEEQDEIGPAAAVLDVAASLDTTTAKSLLSTAVALQKALAEQERTSPTSILSNAAPLRDETSAAAVLHLSGGLLKAAEDVSDSSVAWYQSVSAVAVFDTELPKSETNVEETEASPLTTAESEPPAVFNDEEVQDDGPAAAVVDVAAPLETTSAAAGSHLSEFLFKAADAVLNSSIALQESGASVALHDETSVVFVLFNVALDLYTFAAEFNDEEDQEEIGPAAAELDIAASLDMTSKIAASQAAKVLYNAADVVHNAMAELERTCPSSIVSDVATSLDMTSTKAVSQVASALFHAADAVHNAIAELERTCPSFILSDVAASPDETSAAAGFNNEGEQDDIGRAAAVLDVAASLDMTSTTAVSQVASALYNAAHSVHHTISVLEKISPSSICPDVAALPAETIAAAVLQLYKILFEAADAVFNSSVALQQTGLTVALFDTAAAAFNTTALQDETSVSAVFNLALHLYDAARALQNISAALESTSSSAVCNIGETWYNAAVYINDAAAALHEASPAGTVFETAVAVLDVTVAVDANSAQAWLPVVEAVFNDGEEQDEIGHAAAVLDVAASLDTTTAKSLLSTAVALQKALAEQERTNPTSILSNAAPVRDETSAAAVLHLSGGLLKAAEDVSDSSVAWYQSVSAVAVFETELPKSETSIDETEASPLTTAESEPPAVFNDEEEQDDGPAAAVVDAAAPLETTSAEAVLIAAVAVHNAMAELERTCPSSILSGAAAPPGTTSAAAVLHLSEGLLKAAEAVSDSSVALNKTGSAVAVFDTAAAAFNASALHDNTIVGFMFKVALHLNSAKDALKNVSAALESTSAKSVSNVNTTWYDAAVALNNAAAVLHGARAARAVFGAAVPFLDVKLTLDESGAEEFPPVAKTLFDGAGDSFRGIVPQREQPSRNPRRRRRSTLVTPCEY
ncbi:unnamed protein product [Pleuronectes platessa]|uniref:Uncharacterized protein n=1 Tax=Pleuronectes platessa TaxID=8262 RepID=A0A9N7ZEH8_PLEPL|nr:unnamed protein product [Pleuronectes platessa]